MIRMMKTVIVFLFFALALIDNIDAQKWISKYKEENKL